LEPRLENLVPKKVRIFAWRLAIDSLAVTANLHWHIPRIQATCAICGADEEDAHHVMIRCTLSRALRDGMRKVWELPKEELFGYTGRNWFLLLLDRTTKDMHVKLLFLS
jgi:hypothetical protein